MEKFLIAGLGNPGDAYKNTRHNAGYLVVEELASRLGSPFAAERHAEVATCSYKGRSILLIKPTTFMNLSGKAVAYWLQQGKIKQTNLLVVLDDLALPPGILRIRSKGSDGGHNGLKSIDASLGNNDYARLRFGIGNDFSKGQQSDYVLGPWSVSEMPLINMAVKAASEAVLEFCMAGLTAAMNKFNG